MQKSIQTIVQCEKIGTLYQKILMTHGINALESYSTFGESASPSQSYLDIERVKAVRFISERSCSEKLSLPLKAIKTIV